MEGLPHGKDTTKLPIEHPLSDENPKAQYFACLKCGSSECKGKDQLMAIYQFDDNNQIIDESFKNFISKHDETPEKGENILPNLDFNFEEIEVIEDIEGIINPLENVQYITMNYDEKHTIDCLNRIKGGDGDGDGDDDESEDFWDNQFIKNY